MGGGGKSNKSLRTDDFSRGDPLSKRGKGSSSRILSRSAASSVQPFVVTKNGDLCDTNSQVLGNLRLDIIGQSRLIRLHGFIQLLDNMIDYKIYACFLLQASAFIEASRISFLYRVGVACQHNLRISDLSVL